MKSYIFHVKHRNYCLNIFKLTLLILSFQFVNCAEKSGTESTSSKAREIPTSLEIRKYDDSLNLFLNFYKGMTLKDFEKQVQQDLEDKRLFFKDFSNLTDEEKLWGTGEPLNTDSFENIADFSARNHYLFSNNSNIFYALQIKTTTYYVEVLTTFKDNQLSYLELKGPIYFQGNFKQPFTSRELENFNSSILELYESKFGQPKIVKPKIEINKFYNSLDSDYEYDKNFYLFKFREKVILINIRCCDFHTIVRYIPLSDYDTMLKRENNLDLFERDNQELRNKKTFEDI